MSADKTVKNLRAVEKQYKDRFTSTCEVNISEMARDCANVIESLQAQLQESQRRERAAVDWIQRYTESIDQSCIACRHYTGDSVCKPICGGCGRIGEKSCKWDFCGPGEGMER